MSFPTTRRFRNAVAIGAGILGVFIIIAACTGTKTPAASTGGVPTVQVTDSDGGVCSSTAVQGNGYCPGDLAPPAAAATSPPPATPQYTVSQQQAIASAKDYLNTEPGFSYLGLIGQLDSSAVGFSLADATFGVSTVAPQTDDTFWDAQAAASAKDYMSTEPGWSACGLVQQLDSSAVQFTQSQAEYGAQSVGLGGC